jgi:hypothetical protein
MRQLLSAVLLVTALSPACALAKGEGVGLWMEGQISEVRTEGANIHLVVTGRFWLDQYRGQQASMVEVRDLRGGPARIPATIRQGKPFYAMTADWRGGAIRPPGALLGILQAARTGRVLKFQLIDARLKFGREGRFVVESADVLRATDHDLR